MRLLPLSGLAGSIMLLALAVPPEAADAQIPPATPRGTVTAAPPPADPSPPVGARAPLGTGATQIPANGGRIVLEVNKGTLVRLAGPAATVFVANPDIADVQVKSPTLVYISAKAPGETVIYAVDAADSVLLNAPILVQHDVSRLRSSLRQLAPGERVSADSVDGNLVLSGVVSDAGKADKVRALASSIAGEVKGSQVINRMTVATPNQVNLQVRIAEVSLTVLNNIGVNWRKIGSTVQLLTQNPVTIATELQNSIVIGKQTGKSVAAMVNALAQEGFVTDLAQPNLTAMSGQTASFLAGGEFPVPISGSSSSTGGVPTISVEFKSYGISLAFTPTIIDANHLNLRVKPEVSQLTAIGAVSLPITAEQTIQIPPCSSAVPKLRSNSAAAKALPSPASCRTTPTRTSRRCRGSATSRYWGLCSARTVSGATRPSSLSSSPRISCSRRRRVWRPRPTACSCPTTHSGYSSATSTARGCRDPAPGRSFPAAGV